MAHCRTSKIFGANIEENLTLCEPEDLKYRKYFTRWKSLDTMIHVAVCLVCFANKPSRLPSTLDLKMSDNGALIILEYSKLASKS